MSLHTVACRYKDNSTIVAGGRGGHGLEQEKRSLRGKKVLINCEQLSLRFHISYHSLDGDEWIVIKPQVREPPHTNNEREETKREEVRRRW